MAALERKYLEGLRRAIESHKFYPKRARRRGEEGQALVAFVVQADGHITDVEVRRSSGSKLLDEAAAEALEKLARYQPIPEALRRRRWPLRVPINFALD
jgi:protein TonB